MINTKLLSLIFGTKNFLLKRSKKSTGCAGVSKLPSVNLNIILVLSRVNYAVAIHICINFFRSDHVSPSNLEKLIARNKCPVRPDRNAVRKTHYHSAIGFNYRLSLFLIFVNSFFRQIFLLPFRRAVISIFLTRLCSHFQLSTVLFIPDGLA